MLSRYLVLAVSALAGIASAQNFSTCCDLTTDQVPPSEANVWCRAQRNTCPELCGGQTSENNCYTNNLTYACTCFDSKTPNISDYGQTLPSLMCEEWKTQCVNAHPNDADGQAFCHSFTCGSKNASAVSPATTSSSSASSSSTSASRTSSSASAATTSAAPSSSGAAMALGVGKEYGTGIVGALLFGLFGVLL